MLHLQNPLICEFQNVILGEKLAFIRRCVVFACAGSGVVSGCHHGGGSTRSEAKLNEEGSEAG